MSHTLPKQHLKAKQSLPKEYGYPYKHERADRRLEQDLLSYSVGVLILYLTFRESNRRMFRKAQNTIALGI